jgi:predicted MPP superfamily phosphohydrolase
MKHFIVYLLTWISSNLSIPFWMVGHIHLTMNVYKDVYEILSSLGMNIIVAIGFYLDFKKYKNEQQQTNES